MKNSERKAKQQGNVKQGKKKQTSKPKSSSTSSPAAKKPEKELEVLYQVKTKRDSDIIKAYITFTYRVLHPRVTGRMIFYGLLILVPGFFIKITGLKIACFVIGALVILLALFRQYISLALTKSNDADYRSGAVFTYEFTNNDASFYRNDELTAYISKYKDITSFYYDEDFYYLGIANHDFFILPKAKFTVGDQQSFEDFIYKKSKKTCRWIPNNFRDKMKQKRAARAVRNKTS